MTSGIGPVTSTEDASGGLSYYLQSGPYTNLESETVASSMVPDPDGRAGEWARTIVRPLVTLAFTGGIVYGFVVGLIQPDVFIGMAGGAVGYWFGARGTSA